MNAKIIYKKDDDVRSIVLKVKDKNLFQEAQDQIKSSLVMGDQFLPALVGWIPLVRTELKWYHLTDILVTWESADPMRACFEDFAALFASLSNHFWELTDGLNTAMDFLYRDGSNYKLTTTIVIRGEITDAMRDQIQAYLDEGEYFIPEMVGLWGNRFDKETVDDHPWFELVPKEDFRLTNEQAEADMTVQELVSKFRVAKAKNWGQPM